MKNLLNCSFYLFFSVLICSCGNNASESTTVTDSTATTTDTVQTAAPAKNKVDLSAKLTAFESQCALPGHCDEPACQEEIVVLHELDHDTYWAYVKAFHDANGIPENEIPAPYTRTRAQIEALTNVPCDEHRIKFDLDITHPNTHANIKLLKTAGWERPAAETNSYSVSLFKGILNRNAQSFTFYRATNEGGLNTLAIAAFDAHDNPVFYGDLSDTYPLPIDTLKK
jgi:hypothetical protein